MERNVHRIGGRGEPIVEAETYDPNTGERICRGWQRTPPGDPHFTIPAPEYAPPGLKEQFRVDRPGTYFKPHDLPGRSW